MATIWLHFYGLCQSRVGKQMISGGWGQSPELAPHSQVILRHDSHVENVKSPRGESEI